MRVCIIGLDCLTPQLAFDRYAVDMPHLQRLCAQSLWGPLESVMPPITVPAWACLVTGCDPGQLGVYGFHDRRPGSYERGPLASSLSFTAPPLWTRLARAGRRCFVLGVPLTYPPKPLPRGRMVTGPLTPGLEVEFTYPPELAGPLRASGWRFDVEHFRCEERDKDALAAQIEALSAQHFALAERWIAEDAWDFFMMVDMGPDRMHHAFWRYDAPDHPLHTENHRLAGVMRRYYARLDARLGALLARLRDDDVVLVVSDHGAQSMQGGLALNDWLHARGLLVWRETPAPGSTLDPSNVVWPQTVAWADGGYVGRVHFNVRGRETQGCIEAHELPSWRARVTAMLAEEALPGGAAGVIRTHAPESYRERRGTPPDLTVVIDALRYRALGSVGHDGSWVAHNDRGPDDANHAQHGVIVWRDRALGAGRREDLHLLDVAPTLLRRLGLEGAEEMPGRVLRGA